MELDRALEKLEFDHVMQELSRRCHFSVSSELARKLRPAMNLRKATAMIRATREAAEFMLDLPGVTTGGARDIRSLVERAEKGGRLLPAELQDVAGTASAARYLRHQIVSAASAATRFPRLVDEAVALVVLPQFEESVARSIGPAGEVLDTASDQLGRIRREVRVAHQRLLDRLNRMVSGGGYATALQDHIVTTRDGRYVIPVKAESRGSVPGIVHDSSASGQTLFIEPMDVVELNNKWREAQLDEQHEIERILDLLSGQVAAHADQFQRTIYALAELDLLFAKARLSADWRASEPQLIPAGEPSGGGLYFRKARHPLLDPKTVVPIDVELGETFRILLITGPNTGGKTVALKTIGLLSMMAQAGLFVTAADGARVPAFERIFVDIGDDQSIVQSLSTFSSHITNVIQMLIAVGANDLVLIDELGTGTDPEEGSAIARAVVAELIERGPLVVATTHYSEVKAFAYEQPLIENASVDFDVQTLSPTFRLLMGIPGQSNALAIARRLGMPEGVLERARTLLSPDSVRVDSLLADIQSKRAAAELDREAAQALRTRAQELHDAREAELAEAQQQRFAAFEEARLEAETALTEGRHALRRLQRAAATRPHDEQAPPTDTLRDTEILAESAVQLRQAANRYRAPQQSIVRIREGDRVQVRSLAQEGVVVRLGAEEADVQLGPLRMTRPLEDLKRLGGPPETKSPPVRVRTSSETVPFEIDLRGARYADVEPELDRYLDAAVRTSLPFVRIIHGKGSGALRKGVAEYLKSSPVVARFEPGKASEGGDGVTIVHFSE